MLRIKECTVSNAATTDSLTLVEAIVVDKDVQAVNMRLYMCDFAVLGSEDELEWEIERLEAAPLPPPLG